MVDLREKHDAGWFERVVHRELYGEIEDTAGVGRICRTEYCTLPLEHIGIIGRSCTTIGRRVLA